MHFQRSPMCLQYVRQMSADNPTPPVDQKHIDATFADTVITSTKRHKQLRCEVRNENDNDVIAPEFSALITDVDAAIKNTNDNPDAIFDNADDTQSFSIAEDFINNEQSIPCPPDIHSSSRFMFTTDQKWTVALLKILNDIHAPDYAFASILMWARNASADGYSFHPMGGQSRMANIDVLFQSVHNAQRLLPSVQTVAVLHGLPSDVITFEFAPQLLNLLQNPSIMIADNLLIDLMDPLRRYESPDGRLGDALSGSVYRDAYTRMITDPTRQLFVPIIQWIDRTSISGDGRFSLKPYMFTPAIFKETFRRTIQAWGYHGFLPKVKLSSAQNRGLKQGDNIRNYHDQLHAVLKSFITAGPLLTNVTLPIGPTGQMKVDIITCILYVIQDMQEGDMLCGRYGTHTSGTQRHSRACDVNYDNLDNHNVQCVFLTANDMANIARDPDPTTQKRWSQHKLNNVFDHVPLADPIRGIYGATPVETMHAFRKGMIEVVTFMVLDNVPQSKLAALDALAIRFHKSHRQTIRRNYPATDFSQGITNLTKISAAERLGLVFVFVILSQYDEGWRILQSTLETRKARDNAMNDEHLVDVAAVIEVFEAMLCFDQWLNQPTYWTAANHAESTQTVQKAIRTLMSMCVDNIPLSKTKTWKFPKFHEMLHILDNMERFGAPINYCAQRPESLLIPAAKHPGRSAQKRHDGSQFELQSAQRLSYTLMINTVHNCIWDTSGSPTLPLRSSNILSNLTTTNNATFATLTYEHPSGYVLKWQTKTNVALMHLSDALLAFLCYRFGSQVRLCTEITHNNNTYRCHPSYQSGGPMYDWFNATQLDKQTQQITTFPCRLVTVVLTNEPQQYHLVVQRGLKPSGIKTVLLTEWNMSDDYDVIAPQNIIEPCFVITIDDNGSKVLQTLSLNLWASEFTNPVE